MIDEKDLAAVPDKVLACRPDSKPLSIPKPIGEGVLKIGEMEIPCAVLPGGVRVLSQGRLLIALGRSPRLPTREGKPHGDKLPVFLRSENLKPFIDEDLSTATRPITYQPLGGGRARGVRAEALPMICEVYLNAKDAGALMTRQIPTAKRCRVLQNGFARVGIVALIDEATGYQNERAKRALAQILENYLADEARKWTRTFPLEFYRQIYRLRPGWEWQELENGKKPPTPSVVGIFTDDFVYKRIAPGLREELCERNPARKVRHHQWFNPEQGHPKLREHIAGVIAIMRVSADWNDCREKINQAFPLQWPKGSLFFRADGKFEPLSSQTDSK